MKHFQDKQNQKLKAVLFVLAFPFGLGFWSAAQALTVEPISPYSIITSGSTNTVYYGGNSSPHVDSGAGYKNHNFTITATNDASSKESMLIFEITPIDYLGSSAHPKVISIYAVSDSNYETPLPIAAFGESGSTPTLCNDRSDCKGIINTGGNNVNKYSVVLTGDRTAFRIGIYIKDICDTYTSLNGCGTVNTSSDSFAGVYKNTFQFIVGDLTDSDATVLSEPGSSEHERTNLTIALQSQPATISCKDRESIYFPGDQKINLNTDAVQSTSYPSPIQKLFFIAQKDATAITEPTQSGTSPTSYESTNTFIKKISYHQGSQAVEGFDNTTNGSDNSYAIGLGVVDAAGLVSTIPDSCKLSGVQTSTVQGFLEKSKCFIATAAFGGQDSAPLKTLRLFRNKVLKKNPIGRAMVRTYEHLSPPAAEWVLEHPIVRLPILRLLLPFEFWAWVGLKIEAHAAEAPALNAQNAQKNSSTPYLDRLQKTMPPEDQPGSLIESVQKKAIKNKIKDESIGYTEKLNRENPIPKPEAESYTESIRKQLEENEKENPSQKPSSAIEAVHAGKSKLKPQYSGDINSAFGVRLGTSINRNITTSSIGTTKSFNSIYGNNWSPDAMIFYEFQPFHSEIFGNFGIMMGLGFNYFSGKGVFKYELINPVTQESFGNKSQTEFRFYTIPAMAGINYRFNLLHWLRPYGTLLPTLIPYWETRNDGVDANKGLSYGVSSSVGVGLLLNPLFQSNSWNLYSEQKIQHYYFTLEYGFLHTLSGDLKIRSSGLYAGFTYEL